MKGVNPKTIWTWNAIGKRTGAWNLDDNAKEFTEGFLLNHLIDDLLPADEFGYNYSNSDPITGQAAWFDVRVKIEKAPNEDQNINTVSQPQFNKFELPPTMPNRPKIIKYSISKVKTE